MTLPDQARKGADILTRAQQAMREVQTEADAHGWLHEHYSPNIHNNTIIDELNAMHGAIIRRVFGAGGG